MEIPHRPHTKITWGTLNYPDARTKEIRPVGWEGQKTTRHQDFVTLSRLFTLLCIQGRVRATRADQWFSECGTRILGIRVT